MSVINGNGYGDSHDWERIKTNQWRKYGKPAYSDYKCNKCGEIFTHYYHDIDNIFEAMKLFGVKEKCPTS